MVGQQVEPRSTSKDPGRRGSFAPQPAFMVGKTPFVSAVIAGVPVKYFVDTGSMVSIINREFFKKNLKPLVGAPESPVSWLQLKAANAIWGIRDSGCSGSQAQAAFSRNPDNLRFSSSCWWTAGWRCIGRVSEFQHLFDKSESKSPIGTVRVGGGQHLVVPAGSVMDLRVTGSRVGLETLVEPLAQLIAGNLCECRTLMDTISDSFCVKVVNASERDVTLLARMRIGTVHSVEFVPPQVKLEVNCNEIVVHVNTASATPAPVKDESSVSRCSGLYRLPRKC